MLTRCPLWDSVADLEPNPDPYVFGPPWSGSISQRYGSGSFYHQEKIVRKTLILTVCDFFLTFLSLKNDVNVDNVPSKINELKNFFLNLFFVGKIVGSRFISQRHGSADPYPRQNVMDPQHCFESSRAYNTFMLLYQVKQLASTYSRSNSNLSLKGKQQQQQQQLQQQQDDNSLEFKKMKNGLLNTQVETNLFQRTFNQFKMKRN